MRKILFVCSAMFLTTLLDADSIPPIGAVVIEGIVDTGPDIGASWELEFAYNITGWDGVSLIVIETPTNGTVDSFPGVLANGSPGQPGCGDILEADQHPPCLFALGFVTPWHFIGSNVAEVVFENGAVQFADVNATFYAYRWSPQNPTWFDANGDSGPTYIVSITGVPEPITLFSALSVLLLLCFCRIGFGPLIGSCKCLAIRRILRQCNK